jgi:hypothetical protein
MKPLMWMLIAGIAIGGCVIAEEPDDPEATAEATAAFMDGYDEELAFDGFDPDDCGLEPWWDDLIGQELIVPEWTFFTDQRPERDAGGVHVTVPLDCSAPGACP